MKQQSGHRMCSAGTRGRWIKTALGFALLSLLTTGGIAQAQSLDLQLSGYAKNLGIRSTTFVSDEAYFFDVSRLRVKGLVDAGNWLQAEVWLDNEFWAGNFLKTLDFQIAEQVERPTFVDLDWTVASTQDSRLRQSMFRAFATFYLNETEITAGRQRIAWGTGFAWNPTDLLNPFNPAAIELGEKSGVDAVHVSQPLGSLSKIEAAFAPGRGDLKSSLALRFGTNVGEYDLSMMVGDFQNSKVVGGDFAGYLGDAGLRGEWAYTWPDGAGSYLRAVLNADYNLPGDIYTFIEFYFNGQGTSDKKEYPNRLADLLSGQVFNLARHYLAASANKSLSPLLVASVYSLINLDDGSSLIGPTLSYSLLTNLEITASAYLTRGARDTEYGLQNSIYFASAQFFF